MELMPTLPYSKDAHNCHKCPRGGDGQKHAGCPRWVNESMGFILPVSPSAREGTPVSGCLDALLPHLLRDLTRVTDGHAAAAESGRNEAVRVMDALASSIPATIERELGPAMVATVRAIATEQVLDRLMKPSGDTPLLLAGEVGP